METIIGLLVVLLPLIFKVIEKKLQASGKEAQAKQVRELSEVFTLDDEDDKAEEICEVAPFVPAEQLLPEPAVTELPAKPAEASFLDYLDRPSGQGRTTLKPKNVGVKPSVKAQKPTVKTKRPAVHVDEAAKADKIDPKKLVIYSEIMKTKF